MPSEARHLNQAQRNELCFQELCALSPSRLTEWEVISLFYSALHYAEALLDRYSADCPHPQNHTERETELALHFDDELMGSYLHLHNKSENARYRTTSFSVEEVEELHLENFVPIRDGVHALLSI